MYMSCIHGMMHIPFAHNHFIIFYDLFSFSYYFIVFPKKRMVKWWNQFRIILSPFIPTWFYCMTSFSGVISNDISILKCVLFTIDAKYNENKLSIFSITQNKYIYMVYMSQRQKSTFIFVWNGDKCIICH